MLQSIFFASSNWIVTNNDVNICSSENVRFWCAVNNFRSEFDEEKIIQSSEVDDENINAPTCESCDIDEIAKEIYRSFIDPHSDNPINLSFKQRNEIKNVINSGNCKKETFDAAQREIFSVMSRDSYPRYLASKKHRLPLT